MFCIKVERNKDATKPSLYERHTTTIGMIWILLGVLCSAWLVTSFKIFERLGMNAFQCIMVNYLVCVLTAWVTSGSFPIPARFWLEPWFPYAVGIGFSFITVFNLVALTVQRVSVAMGGLMQKMSLVFAVVFMFLFYHEPITNLKITGIVLAIVAIILTNYTPKSTKSNTKTSNWLLWALPLATLLGSGVVDIGIAYAGRTLANGQASPTITAAIFGSAGVWGLMWLAYTLLTGQQRFSARSILGGIALGVPNYGSIYFMYKAMETLPGSVVFSVNNLGVILATSLIGVLFFGERPSRINLSGIAISLIAIYLLSID